jgi:carboxypeptidase family protein/TonB-dependent receptor-like protein
MARHPGRRSLGTLGVLTVLALIGAATPASAQSTYGAVVGVLTDASKAVLPGATVTLKEVQTNVVRTATSGGDGNYEFLNLTQGRYQVTVEMSGFGKRSTEPFPVSARQTVRIDVELQAAGLSEEVTVRGGAPLINTENPTVSDSKTNREIQQLPFTFRTFNTSPVDVIAVLPEVQKDPTRSDFSLSGGQSYQNEVSVDGISTTNVRRNGIGDGARNLFPSVEGIEEIRVSSINNNAEFAMTGDITTITKAGTNAFHGTGFFNLNNESLNANPNYFSKNIPNKSDNKNYGASLSGPIIHNKTFFFLTYERLSIARTGVATATVPEADFRTGNFARLATPILDPRTGQPFPGNVIPAARINPVSAKLLSKYIGAPNEGLATRRYSIDATETSNQVDLRLDHNFNPGHTAFVRASGKNLDSVSPTTQEASGPRIDEKPSRNLAFSDNWALSPSLLNELRFGYSTADLRFSTGIIGRDFVQDLGLNLLSQSLPQGSGSSRFEIAGYTSFGENKEEPLHTRVIQFGDNVTWLAGRHAFKAGADVRNYHWTSPLNFTGVDDMGVFRFRGTQAGGTGNPLADFLLGIPESVDQTATGPGVDGTATHYGFFVQDEWRFSNKVTLNLGLRYDLYPGFKDAELNITNFLRDTPNGDAVVPNEESRQIAKPDFTSGLGTSRILTAAEAGLPETLRVTDKNNIAPRLGIAWRPFNDNRTVVRAGYGIFYTRFLGAIFNSLTGIHTSDNQTFGNAFDAATRTHAIVLPNTFAGSAGRGGAAVGNQNFSTANDPYLKDPQTHQWSLSLDREIGKAQAARFTYSGRRDRNLTLAPDLNQLQGNTVGFANLPRTARPYPNWSRVNTRDGGGEADYHDLTFQLRGQALSGLSYSATYKWTHAVSNIEIVTQTNFTEEINSRTNNRFDPEYTRGKVAGIPDHRFTATLIWDLPFFKDKAVIGGWTVSSIITAQSGSHLTAYYSSHCGSGTNCYHPEKADAVSGQDPNSGPRTTDQWFNTAAFSNRAFFNAAGRPIFAGRWGDAEKGSIAGPGLYTIDLGLFKDFKITGDTRLRFQVQAQNVTNHPNYGFPNTDLTSPNYGRITSLARGTLGSRVVVLGARLTF